MASESRDCLISITGREKNGYSFQFTYARVTWVTTVSSEALEDLVGTFQSFGRSGNSERHLHKAQAEYIGSRIYSELFPKYSAERLMSQIGQPDTKIRIILQLPDLSLLDSIPSETMFNVNHGGFLAINGVSIIRQRIIHSLWPTAHMGSPREILILASDRSQAFAAEVTAANEALKSLITAERARVTVIHPRSRDELVELLDRQYFDIIHVQEECELDPASGVPSMVIVGKRGPEYVPARIFLNSGPPELIFLSGLAGSRDSRPLRPTADLASRLVEVGIRSVIASTFAIQPQASMTLINEIYSNLAAGKSVDQSVAEARRSISDKLDSTDWTSIILVARDHVEVVPFRRKVSYTPDVLVEMTANQSEEQDNKHWAINSYVRGGIQSEYFHSSSLTADGNWRRRLGATKLGRGLVKEFGEDRAENIARVGAIELLGEIVSLPHRVFSEAIASSQVRTLNSAKRELVVSHGLVDRRLSLLVLVSKGYFKDLQRDVNYDPENDMQSLPTSQCIGIPVASLVTEPTVALAWARLLNRTRTEEIVEELDELVHFLARGAETAEGIGMDLEPAILLWIARPRLLVATMPRMIPLCVPRPPFDVDGPNAKISTAGALVRDIEGRVGVTACFHGTGAVGTVVKLGFSDCRVALAAELHDTVFLPLPNGVNLPELYANGGPLINRPPWETEKVSFWGRTSGVIETTVTSTDKGLPMVRPGKQMCVQTKPDTEEGDSGAALVNQFDNLIGFAFQRTAFGEPIEFTDWIWAAAALSGLGLNALTREELKWD